MNFLQAFKQMKEAGWSDSDVVRLLSCCSEPTTALEFAQYCSAMKQAWSMLEALNPSKSKVIFKDGAWGFEQKQDDVIFFNHGDWHEQQLG